MKSIPVIDISPLVQLGKSCGDSPALSQRLPEVIDQIRSACEIFGFFAVTNHGVDPDIVASAWAASEDFFALDPAVKKSSPMSDDYPYGYENHESLGAERSAAAVEKVDRSPALRPDSKETFSIGPLDCTKSGMPSRRFPPNAPAAFAPALARYFDAMEDLACVLFRGLALALRLDDASWFLSEGLFDEGHQCALRILNCPQLKYAEEKGSKRVHIRAGAHTDYGAMTILKSGGPGLQLRLSSGETNGSISDDNSSSWMDVPHLSSAFVINLGDLMQRWTNDRWKSTLHRVIAVADDTSSGGNDNGGREFQSSARQSIAFFVNINGNATIVPFNSCVDEDHPSRFDAIKASDHLLQRHLQSMGITSKK